MDNYLNDTVDARHAFLDRKREAVLEVASRLAAFASEDFDYQLGVRRLDLGAAQRQVLDANRDLMEQVARELGEQTIAEIIRRRQAARAS
jgi:DNA-binding IclR family transcriptional regulator